MEYTTAFAEVTRLIRYQVRLIEFDPLDSIKYQTKINQEITEFAHKWDVNIRLKVRPFQEENQQPTSISTPPRIRSRRQIRFLPSMAPESQRLSFAQIREFILSLPQVPKDSLGDDSQNNECSICYYSFFNARAHFEGGAKNNENHPRFSINQQPDGVPVSELAEFPVRLPCGHIFGHLCVQVWIAGEESGDPPTCPFCRVTLRPVGCSHVARDQVTIAV